MTELLYFDGELATLGPKLVEVRTLRANGVTNIFTTHSIQDGGKLLTGFGASIAANMLLEENGGLHAQAGQKPMKMQLYDELDAIPNKPKGHPLTLNADGRDLVFSYDSQSEQTGTAAELNLTAARIAFADLSTDQSSLEDMSVDLLRPQP